MTDQAFAEPTKVAGAAGKEVRVYRVYAIDPFLSPPTSYRCVSKPLALSPSPSQHNDNASLSSLMREKRPHRRGEETSTFRPILSDQLLVKSQSLGKFGYRAGQPKA